MKYAVIRLNGKQYKVSEKDEILVDKLKGKPEAELLLLVDDDKVEIGKPSLSKVVKLRIIAEKKGEKIKILKYKAKSRYRRRKGFKPQLTRLLVEKIA